MGKLLLATFIAVAALALAALPSVWASPSFTAADEVRTVPQDPMDAGGPRVDPILPPEVVPIGGGLGLGAGLQQEMWRDDFNYATIQELAGGSWTIFNVRYVSVGGGLVRMDHVGSNGGAIANYRLPGALSEWRVEAAARWAGGTHAEYRMVVATTTHTYGVELSGDTGEFRFLRDNGNVLTATGYQEASGTWETLALQKRGAVVSVVLDGTLALEYSEADTALAYLRGVDLRPGDGATMEWDWIAVIAPGSPDDVAATGWIVPGGLNRKSHGKFVQFFIELPAGMDPAGINATTVRLAGSLAPILDGKYGFGTSDLTDSDGDGVPELRLKFDRSSLFDILTPGTYRIPFDGDLFDGRHFSGFSQDVTVK